MSTPALVQYAGHSNAPKELHLAQKASDILERPVPSTKPFPLSLFGQSESAEIWTEYEQILLACLRTGDDKSAHLCLERLTARFGATNQRVVALRGLYQEAVAQSPEQLEDILTEYNAILTENAVNVPILKRRVAIFKSMQRTNDAITALVDYVEHFPVDVEAWVELGELYQSQGLFSQSIYSMEEALLITPNAWNLHARLGEIEYIAAAGSSEGSETALALLSDALKRFSRSVELCEDYLRGLYGVELVCQKLLGSNSKSSTALPSQDSLQRLDKMARERLSHIVKTWTNNTGSNKYSEREIIAAQELLDRK